MCVYIYIIYIYTYVIHCGAKGYVSKITLVVQQEPQRCINHKKRSSNQYARQEPLTNRTFPKLPTSKKKHNNVRLKMDHFSKSSQKNAEN